MSNIDAPENARAKLLSDFVVFVKEAETIFVDTDVQLNDKGQLFIDFSTPEHMYTLCMAITKHLSLQNWKINNEEVYIYTEGRENRAIMSHSSIMPYIID